MQAVGQLTGGIAHDFNNMLQGIGGAVEVMSRRITQGRLDEAQHYISVARQSIDRAATLTHRLLAFSRRQTLAPQAPRLADEPIHLVLVLRHEWRPCCWSRTKPTSATSRLKCCGTPIACILVGRGVAEPNRIGPEDIRLLRTMRGQIALAMQTIR